MYSKLYKDKKQNGCFVHMMWPRAFQACCLESIPIAWSTNPSFLKEQSCSIVTFVLISSVYIYIFKSPDTDLYPVTPWNRIRLQCRNCTRRLESNPRIGKIPWRGKWPTTPVFLPGEFHGPRTLVAIVHVGAESNTTEAA